MLTLQQSPTQRLSASNIQNDARSDEGLYVEKLYWRKQLEAPYKAGGQGQEAVYSPLG